MSATIVVCVVFFTLGFLFQMYMTRRKKKIQEVEEKTGQSITVRMSAPMKGGYTGFGIAFLLLCFTGMYRSGFNYVISVFMNAMRYRKLYDMMYCAVGFGIGYFITKSKELKSKGAAMEFSVSAMICGLIGADAALILRAVGIVIINHIPVFSVYFMRIMLSRYSLVIGLGGFAIGYVVFDLITGRTSISVKQVGPAEKKQESRIKTAAKMRPAAEKTANSVERVHIFAPNIDNELNYVFSEDILYMMKTMPVIHDNGTWTCSCGTLCTEEYCTICGMIKEDVKVKFTYQYLKWHRDTRLAQEAEQEKELQAERERIRQERLMRRSGARKN